MKFDNIIGTSEAIEEAKRKARRIAKSPNISTLIVGENGTGKELFARFIHQHSANSDKPFVDINCGAIPESLLESELFGHEKGAFTGAAQNKQGLFEIADGGAVFLDEIGNTSASFQSKLLKAVESKRIRRIGSLKEIQVTTRIIAATNIDLKEAVKKKTFREDLYYRLNIGQVFVPPLRKRENDVQLLAEHFLKQCNAEYDRNVIGISDEAMNLIKTYPWPGNVRQLRNTIERAVLIESDEFIELNDLKLDFEWQHFTRQTQMTSKNELSNLDIGNLTMPTRGIPLEELERGIIRSALAKSDGNLSLAARLLKISRGKLRYRMEKFGMEL